MSSTINILKGQHAGQDLTELAQSMADKLVEVFTNGDLTSPEALKFFTNSLKDIPMSNWSWNNRMMVWIAGMFNNTEYLDPRTAQAWVNMGRRVPREAFLHPTIIILKPIKDWSRMFFYAKKGPDGKEVTDSDGNIVWLKDAPVVGFEATPRWDISQTYVHDEKKWAEHAEAYAEMEREAAEFIENLPLREVAHALGVVVDIEYNTDSRGYAGYYTRDYTKIVLGVNSMKTWLHELIHAIEDLELRRGGLRRGQDPQQEATAEIGAAILAGLLGLEPDLAGAYKYVERYAIEFYADDDSPREKVLKLTSRIMDRALTAVQEIISIAQQLADEGSELNEFVKSESELVPA